MVDPWTLAPFFLLGALLYTSVGHGGATVYLAILAIASYPRAGTTTTVLLLNVVAAGIAFGHFQQAGHLRPRLLLSFSLASVPAAYAGGRLALDSGTADALLAGALGLAAFRFLFFAAPKMGALPVSRAAFWILGPLLGAALGFLAGAVGIGGGIFLSPLLVLLGWASVKESASIASAFIVLNSLSGLAARLPGEGFDRALLLPALIAVAVGGLLGSALGARRIPPRGLQVLLGFVLLIAVARILTDL